MKISTSAKSSLWLALIGGLYALVAGSAAKAASAANAISADLAVGNRVVLEVPPGPGNARNSEGAFIALKDGRILFVYSRFIGSDHSDHAKAVLAARRSQDEGETWDADTIIATPDEERAMNVMSVSLLRLQNGDVGLFYCLRFSWHDLRMYVRRSSDEGLTWSTPVRCMPAAEYHVVNNDRVVRLSSGRLIIPAALHRRMADPDAPTSRDWRGQAVFFLSDDDGRTWRESATFAALTIPHTRTGLQEPGVIELPGGTIWAWARTDLGRQYETFSFDGGETWSEPRPSRFTSPNAPLSMKQMPGSTKLLAVWNPIPNYQTRRLERPAGDRTPLVAAIGEGTRDATWGAPFLIDENTTENEGYCYTAIHFTGDSVLLAYCAGGRADQNRLNRLRIRKISYTWLKSPPVLR
jgi:sialidase-1